MRKNILDLSHSQAETYLLRQSAYINFDMPKYFNFKREIDNVAKNISILTEKDILKAKATENVNHIVFSNKDGRFSWRKFQIINPILYVSLVKVLTEKKSWQYINMRLKKSNMVRCLSLPIVSRALEKNHKLQIEEWLEEVEKESIRSALDYEYIYQTDITDCYGSIYTHSIAWGLHDKDVAKQSRNNKKLLGNIIDAHLQAMSYGQTNGIPQGSVLMDFIAEIVLNFADNELSKGLGALDKDNFKIIRFRDDYRIFVRNPNDGEKIMKALGETLSKLGMSLHATKTKKSDSIIADSVKLDKLHNLNIKIGFIRNKHDLRDELIRIYLMSKQYPNSGSIKKRLVHLSRQIKRIKEISSFVDIISLAVNIGYENPSSFPVCMDIVSKVFGKIKNLGKKTLIIEKIFRKIELLPNNGFLELWLQRIFIKDKELLKKYITKFNDPLCKLIGATKVDLFNNSWYSGKNLKKVEYVDTSVLKKLKNTIEKTEISSIDWYLNR